MTAPNILAPPRDFENITTREILSAVRTGDNGDPVPPPIQVRNRTKESLSIYDEAGALRMVRQPAAKTLYHAFNRKWLDATPYTHARIVADVKVVGASGANLLVEYSATPTDDNSWANAGSTVPVAVPIDEAGPQKTARLVPLATGARADVVFRVPALGGDGVLSPEVNAVEIEFDVAVEPRRERWYWRTGTPSVVPAVAAPNLIGNPSTFWACSPAPSVFDWATVTPGDPEATPQVLMRTKGNAEGAFSTTTPNGHWNVSGAVGRIVGPPLQAQNIPAFAYAAGFSGLAYSGSVAGLAALKLHLWRPGVGFVYSSDATFYGALWYRYIAKSHVTTIPMGPMVAQEGDRFVLDVTAAVEISCAGGFVTEGLGVSIFFNGSNDAFVDFGDAPGSTASWLELPQLRYVTETP